MLEQAATTHSKKHGGASPAVINFIFCSTLTKFSETKKTTLYPFHLLLFGYFVMVTRKEANTVWNYCSSSVLSVQEKNSMNGKVFIKEKGHFNIHWYWVLSMETNIWELLGFDAVLWTSFCVSVFASARGQYNIYPRDVTGLVCYNSCCVWRCFINT